MARKKSTPKIETLAPDLVDSIVRNEEHRLRMRNDKPGFSEDERSEAVDAVSKCETVDDGIQAMANFA